MYTFRWEIIPHLNVYMVNKTCVVCGVEYQCWPFRKDSKCCSVRCRKSYQKTSEYRELLRSKHLGKVISEETRKKISHSQKGKRTGKENHLWKGDNVGYRAMHDWIRREKGTPDICEHCGMIGSLEKKRLVWANKSHKYLRDINDWMRLCYPCHRKYDFPYEKHRI